MRLWGSALSQIFEPLLNADANLLAMLTAKISDTDIERFGRNGVFEYSHVIAPNRLLEPLNTKRFPTEDYYSYQFVISEIGWLERREIYTPWFHIYLATLFLYCEAMENKIGDDVVYYFAVLDELRAIKSEELAAAFANFLEWLYVCANWEAPQYRAWSLVAWAVCRSMSSTIDERKFAEVLELLATPSMRAYLKAGDYRRGTIAEWICLVDKFPEGAEAKLIKTFLSSVSE